MEYKDIEHDIDSCKDVWEGLYKKIYHNFFGVYFDFYRLEDKETSKNCKRWYIKLRSDEDISREYPKFKMAGDCIFNFNDKKIKILSEIIGNDKEGNALLKECAERHHSFENFAFMPITGGMNNQKGRQVLDRPDIHVVEIQKYFEGKESTIFSNARGNKKALEWYLSIFEKKINKYFKEVYLIEGEDFIKTEFLPFANIVIDEKNSAIQYMKLAMKFWNKRRIVL